MSEIVTRATALAAGLTSYYTGKACHKGHLSERFVSTFNCAECLRERRVGRDAAARSRDREAKRAWEAANLDKKAAYRRRNYLRKAEERRAYSKAFYWRDPEAANRKAQEWREQNPDRVARQEAEWRRRNMASVIASNSYRRASQKSATPTWADRAAIVAVYREAARLTKETGIPHHVDHIVPLVSPLVCGLHVPWNLRAIPAQENRKKKNRLIEVPYGR